MPFTPRLLWTHEGRSSHIRRTRVQIKLAQRQSKIGHVSSTFAIDQNIARFDVSMDYIVRVRIAKGIGYGGDDFCHLRERWLHLQQPIGPGSDHG